MLQGLKLHRVLGTFYLQTFLMEAESDSSPPDSQDDAEFKFNLSLDLQAAFIKELEGLSGMAGPDISDIIDYQPTLQEKEIKSMSVHDAAEFYIEHIQVIHAFL